MRQFSLKTDSTIHRKPDQATFRRSARPKSEFSLPLYERPSDLHRGKPPRRAGKKQEEIVFQVPISLNGQPIQVKAKVRLKNVKDFMRARINRSLKFCYARRGHYYTPYWKLPKYYEDRRVLQMLNPRTPVEALLSSAVRTLLSNVERLGITSNQEETPTFAVFMQGESHSSLLHQIHTSHRDSESHREPRESEFPRSNRHHSQEQHQKSPHDPSSHALQNPCFLKLYFVGQIRLEIELPHGSSHHHEHHSHHHHSHAHHHSHQVSVPVFAILDPQNLTNVEVVSQLPPTVVPVTRNSTSKPFNQQEVLAESKVA